MKPILFYTIFFLFGNYLLAQNKIKVIPNTSFDSLQKAYFFDEVNEYKGQNFFCITFMSGWLTDHYKGYLFTLNKKGKIKEIFYFQKKMKDSFSIGEKEFFEKKFTKKNIDNITKNILDSLIRKINWNSFSKSPDSNSRCANMLVPQIDYINNIYGDDALYFQTVIKYKNKIRSSGYYNYDEVTKYCGDFDKQKVWQIFKLLNWKWL